MEKLLNKRKLKDCDQNTNNIRQSRAMYAKTEQLATVQWHSSVQTLFKLEY